LPCFQQTTDAKNVKRFQIIQITAASQRVAVIRSKRDGEHCKRGGRSNKAKACHHHDRDERVSGAKRQNNHLSATRHLPGGAQNGGDGRASSSIDIGGLYHQRKALLKAGHARPQQDDGGGKAPAYAEGLHKIENGPPWLILCNRAAVASIVSSAVQGGGKRRAGKINRPVCDVDHRSFWRFSTI